MALVTLTSTEEAIDALIVSFILLILKSSYPLRGFINVSSQNTIGFHMQGRLFDLNFFVAKTFS